MYFDFHRIGSGLSSTAAGDIGISGSIVRDIDPIIIQTDRCGTIGESRYSIRTSVIFERYIDLNGLAGFNYAVIISACGV